MCSGSIACLLLSVPANYTLEKSFGTIPVGIGFASYVVPGLD